MQYELLNMQQIDQKKRKEELAERFNKILKGKFNLIPEGSNFKSNIKGVNYINILTPEEPTQAFAYISYNIEKDGRSIERYETASIFDDGTFSMKMPRGLKNLGVTHEDIFKEVLDDLESINMDKMIMDDDGSIIPPEPISLPYGEGKGKKEKAIMDKQRLAFFMKQEGLIYAAYPSKLSRKSYGRNGRFGSEKNLGGLSDYHYFVFKKGLIFENAVCENNVYFSIFDEDVKEFIGKELSRENVDRKSLITFAAELNTRAKIKEEKSKYKSELKSEGKRYPENHPDHNAAPHVKDAWYKRMQTFIDENLI